MTSKLIRIPPHEAENQFELSLRQAFNLLEPKLKPPFPLTIPTPEEYSQLNHAILYSVLSEPRFAKIHIKYLHAIVTDGYTSFLKLLIKIVNELYAKLVDTAKDQLVWVTNEMINVSGIGVGEFLVCLLRQIIGGDFSEGNLWLCFELVSIFLTKWDCLLEEEPLILASALYTYLRLLSDHCKLQSNQKLEALKRLEIEFCIKVLREQFHLCLKIGRDIVRLLQDLVHVPEFRAIWKALVLNPNEFRTPGFSDISQLYRLRTSRRYFLLRVTPEMEIQLRFLLTNVKFGSQKRYQTWFARKFLCVPERESLIIDLVRFICCAHHPPNEIIQSDVIPRWAVIGWLLKCCRRNYLEASVKLALFYDWLFFDERADNVMNIEPAMLLMVCSIPKYIDITHNLLEFLLLLVDNYDVDHNDIVVRGVSLAFSVLVQKGVVCSLDVLTSCDVLSPFLKERLVRLLSGMKVGVSKEMSAARLPSNSTAPLSLPNLHCMEIPTPAQNEQPTSSREDELAIRPLESSVPTSVELVTSSSSSVITRGSQVDALEILVQNLGEIIKKSKTMGLQSLEEILMLYVNLDNPRPANSEGLSSKITKEFEFNGYKLFAPLENSPGSSVCDDEIGSATAFIIRTFIFSQHEKLQEMLLFWSRSGLAVGARLLSYISRLACEAYLSGYLENVIVDNNFAKGSSSGMLLLIFHVDGYFSLLNGSRREDAPEAIVSSSKMDGKLVSMLVDNAFAAYRCFLEYSRKILHKETSTSLSKLLSYDIISCSGWVSKRLKFLFRSIFGHLADFARAEEVIIRLLVNQLDHADLVDMQFEIGLRKISVFGENTETIFHLFKSSLNWDCLEQHKFWGLIRSELAISKVQVEKIVLEFFCLDELDATVNAIAVEGLLTLCCCCAPTPELVGAIMFLPNNKFQKFSAAVLATWAVSNASMLFESLAKFSEKFDNKNGDSIFSNSTGIMINHSAILWLLNYFNAQGMEVSNILSNISVNISDINMIQQ